MSERFNKAQWKRALLGELGGRKAVVAMAMALESHSDRNGANVRPGHRRLAKYLRYKEERQVRKLIKELTDAGWISIVSKAYNTTGETRATVYQLTFPSDVDPGTGERVESTVRPEHHVPVPEEVRPEHHVPVPEEIEPVHDAVRPEHHVPVPGEENPPDLEGGTGTFGALDRNTTFRLKDHYKGFRTSVNRERSTAPRTEDSTPHPHGPSPSVPEKETAMTATPIPDSWHTNGVHVQECKHSGMDTQALASDFRRWARGKQIRRSDWDSTFGELIRLLGDNQCPDLKGFTDWESYGCSGRDDYEPPVPRRCPECGKPVEAGQVRHPACFKELRRVS